jgi:hypothetical protein
MPSTRRFDERPQALALAKLRKPLLDSVDLTDQASPHRT